MRSGDWASQEALSDPVWFEHKKHSSRCKVVVSLMQQEVAFLTSCVVKGLSKVWVFADSKSSW